MIAAKPNARMDVLSLFQPATGNPQPATANPQPATGGAMQG
jgi:hypothetical protein